LQNVAQAPLMAQVAASGLIVSFALTASMVIMVSSFRVAVDALARRRPAGAALSAQQGNPAGGRICSRR
jgi:hypothetical protein